MKLKNLILILFIWLGVSATAQDVKFVGSAPNVVKVGERFRLTYSLNAKPSGYENPNLKNFKILSGPNVSTNSSVQIVNGKMTKNVNYSYTYIIQAVKIGKFTITPAKTKVDKKIYSSNSLVIDVVKGSATASGSSQQNNNTANVPGSQNVKISDDLELKTFVSKKSPYYGEGIIITTKLYSTTENVSSVADTKMSDLNGFYKYDLKTLSDLRYLQRENVNGKIYHTGIVYKALVFPQKDGVIQIDPTEIEWVIRQRVQSRSRSIFDDFFGGNYKDVKVKTKSKPIKINVKPLPKNAPETFAGAVGSFKLYTSIDSDTVTANDALTLVVKVSGKGNVKLIDAPKIDFPPDFEVYDPKISNNVKNSENGSTGTKTFEYLIQPRHAGKYRIPPIKFTYFDLKIKQYKTLSGKQFNIFVEKGNEDQNTTLVSGYNKEDIKFIGSDIRFIKTDIGKLAKINEFVFGSIAFILIYIMSLVLFFGILLLRRNQIKRNANAAMVRNRKASKISKKRLQHAKVYLKKNEEEIFYDEITKALWGYISDKLIIPVADLTKDKAKLELQNKQIEENTISKFLSVLDECEYARFAPSKEGTKMLNIYNDAAGIITDLERKIK